MMEFYYLNNKLESPYVVYADTECSLFRYDEPCVMRNDINICCIMLYVDMINVGIYVMEL